MCAGYSNNKLLTVRRGTRQTLVLVRIAYTCLPLRNQHLDKFLRVEGEYLMIHRPLYERKGAHR